jgi:hypothetical protein
MQFFVSFLHVSFSIPFYSRPQMLKNNLQQCSTAADNVGPKIYCPEMRDVCITVQATQHITESSIVYIYIYI